MKIFIFAAALVFQISMAQGQTFDPGLPPTSAPPASSSSGSTTSSSGAPTNANGASNNAMILGIAEGATSVGMGVYLMVQGQAQITAAAVPPGNPALAATGHMEMMMGGSLVAAGAVDAIQGFAGGYSNTGQQIAAGTSVPTTAPPPDPYIQGLLNTANQIAAQSGTTVPALANQANSAGGGSSDGGGGDMGSFADSLPQSVKDGMAKAAADAKAHYHVSAIATEGGGGARKSDGPFDLNGLLNGLKNDRDPASVAGLQKSLNGQPIGVAQDNIFQQITRKYQSKIALRMFLPFQK